MWGRARSFSPVTVALVAALIALASDTTDAAEPPEPLRAEAGFATWQGVEPDKWATVWLIKRHFSPDAYFLLLPPNSDIPPDLTPFGVPEASISRQGRESMFRRLARRFQLDAVSIRYVDSLIQDIEVNIWEAPLHPHSAWFEAIYRQLQARYDRDQVPVDCYLALFDRFVRVAKNPDITLQQFQRSLDITQQCPGLSAGDDNAFVRAMDQREILRQIGLGKRVVFVDTREVEEYDEVHLPGARVLRLRDVTSETVASFAGADLVVPYCVKDFRGFEVAKAMKKKGLSQVATLSPSGLRGWIAAGLPVVRPQLTSEPEATEALLRCATEPDRCIGRGS
ncbi:hypothetical protein F6455_05255 [Proteobacteria bacterium 005FR1]|nr:hypothetical protein [Proteobacteria bacterium 005FR1]